MENGTAETGEDDDEVWQKGQIVELAPRWCTYGGGLTVNGIVLYFGRRECQCGDAILFLHQG